MTLETLHELESKLKIDHNFADLLPFLILCKGWQEKYPDFILNNFNALAGDQTWELLNEEERFKMYDYLCTHDIEDDERFKGLKEFVIERKTGEKKEE